MDLNIDLIHHITGLSKTGRHPDIQTTGKIKDSKLPQALVTKYQLHRGGRAYDISSIQNETLRFTTTLLVGRLLTKVRPKEVTGSVIHLAIQVTEGEQFNWSLFLLNMLQADCLAAQDEANHPFHFSWLLILYAFVGWKEPPHTQFPQIAGGAPRGVRYASLWETNSPAKKAVNMMVFHEYYKLLMKVIQDTPWLNTETVDIYDRRLNFMADSHLICLRPKRTKRDDWAPGSFRMIAQDVEGVTKDFDDQWK